MLSLLVSSPLNVSSFDLLLLHLLKLRLNFHISVLVVVENEVLEHGFSAVFTQRRSLFEVPFQSVAKSLIVSEVLVLLVHFLAFFLLVLFLVKGDL